MRLRTGWLTCTLALLPVVVEAQALSGLAEVAAGRGTSTSSGQTQENNSFWQGYTLNFSSPLISPRLMKINTEVSFRAGQLSLIGPENGQRGTQKDLGYKLGGVLFPAGHFPLTVQATRDNVAESGDYPSSNGIRGGIVVPPGEPSPDFRTQNKSLGVGWQLNTPSLPHVDLGYRKSSSVVTGGPFRGEQRDDELNVGVAQETTHTRQTLRYQRNAYESPLSQAFNQRLDDLDYEFGATLASHLRTSTRIGRRTHFSLFDVPSKAAGAEVDPYQPPVRGDVNTVYALTSINFDPWRRFSMDLTGSVDRQRASGATTNARVASGSARLEVFPGFSLNAVGTYGDRGQIVDKVPVTVTARSGQAGATYRAGIRWLQGSVGYTGGMGSNTTPDGRVGITRSNSGQADLALSVRGLGLSGGYSRSENRDQILDFGNFSIERKHAAVQSHIGRVEVNGSWEQSRVERGRAATYSNNLQRTFSGSVSLQVGRSSVLSANGGGFRNEGTFGNDRAMFAGVALETQLSKSLHVSSWVRVGDTVATLTKFDQKTLYGYAQAEYKLRQFSVAVEYRHNDQRLLTGDLSNPYSFRGHQVMVRISRKFGVRV